MDATLLLERLGSQIEDMRKSRGLTQVQLAYQSGMTRQKLAEVEKGSPTVAVNFYAKVLAALNAEIKVVSARRPTFEELREVFQ
ncbi:helix-turn-helix domain-containing protein [Pseudomonas petrae]|uniref:Helix-turn-helix domain-containing protein n=1 Tax=Pseudomonas petrae TaxID=2912190 RepID=A0ABS9I9M0_9PSED|nr:helix-turn-helix domain-containing protein [Pseudomonas petrae]MCF7535269.1 helix-turn-helix domain-containing protein [Pseudomonas petrae]MCF7540441.1 helix-turn-helix domain-containing protein [Pseudomonas petrae]MCF7544445.1 helix-turn-helix domain-containing protein [Pseudomonas petrae]MCF7558499.1 helix-turn-helix domain-containing protein [Pseudomonas petrae]